jgi:hypothetical protein
VHGSSTFSAASPSYQQREYNRELKLVCANDSFDCSPVVNNCQIGRRINIIFPTISTLLPVIMHLPDSVVENIQRQLCLLCITMEDNLPDPRRHVIPLVSRQWQRCSSLCNDIFAQVLI